MMHRWKMRTQVETSGSTWNMRYRTSNWRFQCPLLAFYFLGVMGSFWKLCEWEVWTYRWILTIFSDCSLLPTNELDGIASRTIPIEGWRRWRTESPVPFPLIWTVSALQWDAAPFHSHWMLWFLWISHMRTMKVKWRSQFGSACCC